MKISNNTILITGGGSGIGLELALAFKERGNTVIVAGRSAEKLELAKSKGLHTFTVDMNDHKSIQKLASDVTTQFAALNVVIQNAGVMVNEKITSGDTSHIAAYTIATNLTGPIFLTNALLPHLLKQSHSTIMTVTSGLAYVPLAMNPTYSATKAGIHAYAQSIRFQLKGTSVEVKELVPPYVQTTLMGARQAEDPHAMPLKDFITEVMNILETQPEAEEILVGKVLPQRTAAHQGAEAYNHFFHSMNERLMNARKEEWEKI